MLSAVFRTPSTYYSNFSAHQNHAMEVILRATYTRPFISSNSSTFLSLFSKNICSNCVTLSKGTGRVLSGNVLKKKPQIWPSLTARTRTAWDIMETFRTSSVLRMQSARLSLAREWASSSAESLYQAVLKNIYMIFFANGTLKHYSERAQGIEQGTKWNCFNLQNGI